MLLCKVSTLEPPNHGNPKAGQGQMRLLTNKDQIGRTWEGARLGDRRHHRDQSFWLIVYEKKFWFVGEVRDKEIVGSRELDLGSR